MAGNDKMGFPYVQNGYPAGRVVDNMLAVGVPTTLDEVTRMWKAYYDVTVNQGVAEYDPKLSGAKNLPIIKALQTATGYDRGKVVAWLNGTVQALAGVDYNERPTVSEIIKDTASDVGQVGANIMNPIADPVTNILKWTAIGVVGAAVIYGLYNFSKMKGRG